MKGNDRMSLIREVFNKTTKIFFRQSAFGSGYVGLGLRNGCGRKNLQRMLIAMALWLTGTGSTVAETPQLQIEVNNTPTLDDDYFCWTPVPVRMRMTESTEPVSVVVSSRSGEGGGEVVFQTDEKVRPTSSDFASEGNITLTLKGNRKWVAFWVAGRKASTEGKDTEIVVTRSKDGKELTSIPVMVRVRKNAATLTSSEIVRFLRALRSHHDVDNLGASSKYMKYVKAHREGSSLQIHGSNVSPYPPLFLVWHRALLLSLERELQAIDPRVAIPYWRFDKNDGVVEGDRIGKPIFSNDFMGTISGGHGVLGGGISVQFETGNPLDGWVVAGGPRLARVRDGTKAVIPPARLQGLLEAGGSASYRGISKALEESYHDYVHLHIGGILGRVETAPADPLFFLLHANVDRAWALWQHSDPDVRLDPTHVDAYPAQGRYPGKTTDGPDPLFRMGSYVKDPMWPWGGYPGNQNNEDAPDDWPDMRFDLLPGPGVGGSVARPTPASMIDYLDVRGAGTGTGACYDHLRFG